MSSAGFESPHALTWLQVGLLVTSITSAILYVETLIGPGPNDETNALLIVLIYATNSTLLGGGPPPPLAAEADTSPWLFILQTILELCLNCALLGGLCAMFIKFLPDSCTSGWRKMVLARIVRWGFTVIRLLLTVAFVLLLVAINILIFVP